MKRILPRRIKASTTFSRQDTDVSTTVSTKTRPFGLLVLVEGVEPSIDVIALHGLNGHREKTWTAKNGTMWLRDLLPGVMPNARIMTYGYDSRTHATDELSQQTLYGHATTFCSDLALFREATKTARRPIIFLVHSLGGLVLKSALIHSDACREGHLAEQKSIKLSTCGIMFFGTPHEGGNGVALGEVVLRIASLPLHTNDRALKHLKHGSEWLETQLGQYSAISDDFPTVFFYESYPTPLPLGSKIIVPKASATISGMRNAETFEVRKDHHTMIKFEDSNDADFQAISLKIKLMVQKANELITKNWYAWDQSRNQVIPEKPSRVAFNIPVSLPFARNHNFVGREHILDEIHSAFEQSSEATKKSVIVYGAGGLGKTQTALEYAYLHCHRYSTVIWVDAQSESTTFASISSFMQRIVDFHADSSASDPDYSIISRQLRLSGMVDQDGRLQFQGRQSRIIEAAKHWLQQDDNDNWLLILDNVDDLESFRISDYLPSQCYQKILITSRRTELSGLGHGIALDHMSLAEGLSLFCKSVRKDENALDSGEIKASTQIVNRLGLFPLAIDQAGAYIQKLNLPLQNYVPLFEQNFQMVMAKKPPNALWLYRQDTVFTTWEVSYNAISAQCPDATEILTLSSFFSNQDIPEVLFKISDRLHSPPDIWISEATATLSSYSLIERSRDTTSFSMHPLIHDWARERLSEEAKKEYTLKAIRGLGAVLKDLDPSSIEGWDLRRQTWPQLQSLDKWAQRFIFQERMASSVNDAEYFYCIGVQMIPKEGDMDALPWLQVALRAQEDHMGKEHGLTILTINKIGDWYLAKNDLEKAREHYDCAYVGWKSLFGEAHDLTLGALRGIAAVNSRSNEVERSLELSRQILAIRKQVLGENHINTLEAAYEVGLRLFQLGRTYEALDMAIHALSGGNGIDEGPTSPGDGWAYRTGTACLVLGQYEESARNLPWATNRGEQIPCNTEVSNGARAIQTDDGSVDKEESKFETALSHYQKVLSEYIVVQDIQHSSIGSMLRRIADAQHRSGQYDDAIISYTKLLNIHVISLGEQNVVVLGLQKKIAAVHLAAGRHQDALVWYLRQLRMYLASKRRQDSGALEAQQDLRSCIYLLGDHPDSIVIYLGVLEQLNALDGIKPSLISETALLLAAAFQKKKAFSDAFNYSQIALQKAKGSYFSGSSFFTWAYSVQGRSAARLQNWTIAIEGCVATIHMASRAQTRRIRPKDAMDTICEILQAVGKELLFLRQGKLALICYQTAHKCTKAANPTIDHPALCDECSEQNETKGNLSGKRYVCFSCDDCDFCESCMGRYGKSTSRSGECKNHEFLLVEPLPESEQYPGEDLLEKFRFVKKDLETLLAILSPSSENDDQKIRGDLE